jgi:hypothetical protein
MGATVNSDPVVPIEITRQVAGVVSDQSPPLEFAATVAGDSELDAPFSAIGAVVRFLQTYFLGNVGRLMGRRG